MKCLLVTSDAYGCNGGIALYNRDLAEAIASLPATREVTVLARNLQSQVPALPARVSFDASAAGGGFRFLLAVGRQLLGRHDLVICGHINLLPIAALLAWRSRCPLVLMAYGIDVWAPPASRLVCWLAQRVQAFWSISEFTYQRASEWLRINPSSYRLLPNAIHLDRYTSRPVAAELAARYRGQATHMLLTLGRLAASERYKGIDEMLDVLPEILKTYPGLRYVVAGDGDDRPRLEQRAAQLGLGDHVHFAGFIRETDKADLYRMADVFAMPGRGEGFGFVFLEALACGTPVVASTIDGSFEAVREGTIGLAANPDDLAALRTALLAALAQPRGIPDGLAYFSFDEFRRRLDGAIKALPLRTRQATPLEETA